MILTALGWVVVHSLWQGLVVAGLTAAALGLLPSRHARLRYLAGCVALALMVVLPVLTAVTGAGAVRWRMSWATMETINLVVAYPRLIWWASVIIPMLGAIWLAGAAAMIGHVGREVVHARRLVRVGLTDPSTCVASVVQNLRGQVGVTAAVRVQNSSKASVPMVVGWRRPLILLPVGTADRMSPSQLRTILAHELAHIRRRDYLVNLGQVAGDVLLWHQPAARRISRLIRSEREHCCDDVAVRVGGDAAEYAHALAALEDARAESGLVVAASSGTLLDRIERVAGRPRRTLTPAAGVAIAVLACLAASAILAVTMIVPPALPFGTEMRLRSPAPAGFAPPAPASDAGLPKRARTPG